MRRVIICIDCGGRGDDGLGGYSTSMTWEEVCAMAKAHRCKTCEGFGKIIVEIIGTARPTIPS